ncbi:response regulator [Variovorax atrisoli]|uniref:response regulator n=1 Tax=Variovorax atrisoli TaxID=3394203 RepID=UPI0003800329|nr:response regulator [Variovorax paradoxus]
MNIVAKHEILIVDDDEALCEVLSDVLEAAGFAVQAVPDGSTMFSALARGAFSLVLIDLRLRHEDGMELARALRQRSRIPIIMLTGKGNEMDRVLGLETAADDFVMKPFDNRELIARIRALLRRASEVGMARATRVDPVGHERYRFGDWVLNLTTRKLMRASGEECVLTYGEFALLEVLISAPNCVFSREQLIMRTHRSDADAIDRTIDVLVLRLRRKIEVNPSQPRIIQTERGSGYRFSADLVRC